MGSSDDVQVLDDTRRHFEDEHVLRVKVMVVPKSEKYSDSVKYRYHYGRTDGTTLIRYDNSHGVHERHTREGLDDTYTFPGYEAVKDRFWEEFDELRA